MRRALFAQVGRAAARNIRSTTSILNILCKVKYSGTIYCMFFYNKRRRTQNCAVPQQMPVCRAKRRVFVPLCPVMLKTFNSIVDKLWKTFCMTLQTLSAAPHADGAAQGRAVLHNGAPLLHNIILYIGTAPLYPASIRARHCGGCGRHWPCQGRRAFRHSCSRLPA